MEDINVLLSQIQAVGDMTLTDADVQEWCARSRLSRDCVFAVSTRSTCTS
jgi:hypothetical protein